MEIILNSVIKICYKNIQIKISNVMKSKSNGNNIEKDEKYSCE